MPLLVLAGLAAGALLAGAAMLVIQLQSGARAMVSERPPARPATATSPDPVSTPEPAPSAAVPAPTRAQADADRISRLLEENRELAALNETMSRQLVDIFNWILANFRGKYPLPEQQVPKLKLSAVTEDLKVHGDVAEFLKISPQEEALLNDAFAYAGSVLDAIEQDVLTLTRTGAEKVIVHIPPYPEEGAELRDELYAAMAATLGPTRFDRFIDVSKDGLDSSFHLFGNASRTIIFETLYQEEDEAPRLRIKDGWVIEQDPNKRIIQATETTYTELPEDYARYLQRLPEVEGGAADGNSF